MLAKKTKKTNIATAVLLASVFSGEAAANQFYFVVNMSNKDIIPAEAYEVPRPRDPIYGNNTQQEKEDAWAQYASDNSLTYGSSWNSIIWNSQGLSSLPKEAYPNNNPPGSINLSGNTLQNVDAFHNVESVGNDLNLTSNPLSNVLGLGSLTYVGNNLFLSGTDINALWGLDNLVTVSNNLNISGNSNLVTLSGLGSLTYVGGILYLNNNPLLDDISSLENLSSNDLNYVLFDNRSYEIKNSFDSPFCAMVNANPGKIKYQVDFYTTQNLNYGYVCEYAPGTQDWVQYAVDNGLSYSSNWNVTVWENKGLTSLPESDFPSVSPHTLNLSKNDITNVRSLQSIMSVSDTLDLGENPNLDDLTGLENIAYTGTRIFLPKDDFGTRLPYDSDFCLGIKDGSVTATFRQDLGFYTVMNPISDYGICHPSPGPKTEWEQLVIDKRLIADDVNWNSIIANGESINALPSESYPNANPTGNIFFGNNNLSNVDSLSSLVSVGGGLNLSNNPLTDINSLSGLTTVGGTFSLHETDITNVDGLSALTSVSGNLTINDTNITNVNGLSSLNDVGELRLHANPSLSDLTGLSNLTSATRVQLSSGITVTNKPAFNSPFCQAAQAGTLLVQYDSLEYRDGRSFSNMNFASYCQTE